MREPKNTYLYLALSTLCGAVGVGFATQPELDAFDLVGTAAMTVAAVIYGGLAIVGFADAAKVSQRERKGLPRRGE